MIVLPVLPLLIWIPNCVYVAIRNANERRWRLFSMAVWIASMLVIAGIHYDLATATRHDADEIVAAIKKYKSEYGTYPPSVEMIGMSQQQIRKRLGFGGYFFEKGQPDLFYANTFIIFHTYHYDFLKDVWVAHGD